MAVATLFSTQMTSITGNAGGTAQVLPNVSQVGGRKRSFTANITLAAQASGSTIGIARIPLGAQITGITLLTDTSLATAQISFGDSNNAALYAAAAVLTAVNTPTPVGKAGVLFVPITAGYNCVNGLASTSFEDIVMVTSVAALPASGNLAVEIEYTMD